MDTLGALALATEPPNDDMMKRPPVRRGDSFITKVIWRNIMGQSLYQLVVLGALMFGGEQLLNIKGADSKYVINTLIFNSFVFCQVSVLSVLMSIVVLRSTSFQTLCFWHLAIFITCLYCILNQYRCMQIICCHYSGCGKICVLESFPYGCVPARTYELTLVFQLCCIRYSMK